MLNPRLLPLLLNNQFHPFPLPPRQLDSTRHLYRVPCLNERHAEMGLFDWIFNAILSREHRERIWQANWEKSVAAAAAARLRQEAAAKLEPEDNTAPSINLPLSAWYSGNPRRTPNTRQYINYDSLMSLTAKKPQKPRKEVVLLYPLPPLGPMEGIGKNRRAVDATDDYLSMLQRNTLDAQQPLISDHDRASRYNTDTTSPPAKLIATQLGTKVKAHPIAEMPGGSGAAAKNNSGPVLAVISRRAPGGNRERDRGRSQEGCRTDAGASGTKRRPPWI